MDKAHEATGDQVKERGPCPSCSEPADDEERARAFGREPGERCQPMTTLPAPAPPQIRALRDAIEGLIERGATLRTLATQAYPSSRNTQGCARSWDVEVEAALALLAAPAPSVPGEWVEAVQRAADALSMTAHNSRLCGETTETQAASQEELQALLAALRGKGEA